MSILIKDMEIPVSCEECLKIGWHYVFECNLDDVEEGEKLITCPLIPVSSHGDLIERSAASLTDFEIVMCDGSFRKGLKMLLDKIDNAPTIISAEEDK